MIWSRGNWGNLLLPGFRSGALCVAQMQQQRLQNIPVLLTTYRWGVLHSNTTGQLYTSYAVHKLMVASQLLQILTANQLLLMHYCSHPQVLNKWLINGQTNDCCYGESLFHYHGTLTWTCLPSPTSRVPCPAVRAQGRVLRRTRRFPEVPGRAGAAAAEAETAALPLL